jgi:hypothetical protein
MCQRKLVDRTHEKVNFAKENLRFCTRLNNCLSLCFIEFDRHEVSSYEEVAKMPPFERKTLVLIGEHGTWGNCAL